MIHEPTDSIEAFVPSLIRHIRLMTGSEEIGGIYARRTLEWLATHPDHMAGIDSRVALFQTFYALWAKTGNRKAPRLVSSRHHPVNAANDDLGLHVALLTDVERFSAEQVAGILGIDLNQVTRTVEKTRRHAAMRTHDKVLVIEDDALMAKHLNEVTQELGLTVIHVSTGVQDAVRTALDEKPSMLLVDVQLRRGETGLRAALRILQQLRIPVIFVTGYPWLLKGDGNLDPTFVVDKPFRVATLKARIALMLEIYSVESRAKQRHAMLLDTLRRLTSTTSEDTLEAS